MCGSCQVVWALPGQTTCPAPARRSRPREAASRPVAFHSRLPSTASGISHFALCGDSKTLRSNVAEAREGAGFGGAFFLRRTLLELPASRGKAGFPDRRLMTQRELIWSPSSRSHPRPSQARGFRRGSRTLLRCLRGTRTRKSDPSCSSSTARPSRASSRSQGR
jgi:hypothetical protein